jgi:hypothetical protein
MRELRIVLGPDSINIEKTDHYFLALARAAGTATDAVYRTTNAPLKAKTGQSDLGSDDIKSQNTTSANI